MTVGDIEHRAACEDVAEEDTPLLGAPVEKVRSRFFFL